MPEGKPDLIDRSVKGRNWPGTLAFVGTRLADPFLQFKLLSNGPTATSIITRLGGTVLPKGPPLLTATPLDSVVGLSPYRSILLAMSVGSMVKQNAWVLGISNEPLPVAAGAAVGAYNAVWNSLNSLLFVCSQTSASVNGEHFPQTPLLVGSGMFCLGLFLEWYSEVQRAAFKSKPENQGRIYQRGLFGLSRHINYFGYMVWRSGYALAAGGWIWAAVSAAFFSADFLLRGIPVLQNYCEKRYGSQFEEYKRNVPYKFVPYLY